MSRFFKIFLLQSIFVLSLIFLINVSSSIVIAETPSWDDNWAYSQKIIINFDTSLDKAVYQPIDINIKFDSQCYAKDELEHSIRVCCWDGMNWYELESQIYDLDTSSDQYIESCNIVFLIPEIADGSEEYYIYYDDSEKPKTQYEDHVSISESYYRYEPISGYPLESSYYKIEDDGIIPYIVSQEGQFMGYNTGQHVTKLIENATEVLPKYGDLFAAFDFKYCYGDGLFDYSSTSQKLLNKEVFVDGNLMLSFGMISTSKNDDLKTTVHYKYYHCPTSTTRMRAHVKHESLKDIQVISEASTDGVFASLQSGGVKSNSIEDLNIGSILPYMHFINEYDEIFSYDLDTDPDYIPNNPDIRIVSYEDDVDLGNQPWISFNEGENGLSHAVLFHSNQILVSGENENDGLQLNAFQMDYPHLPGLENNIATIQIGRNSYESSSGHDLEIPTNLIVEFDAEFFTSRAEGVNSIKTEAEIFNAIIGETTSSNNEYDSDEEDTEKYTLTVNIHQSPSFPLGSSLSAASGINLSFITAELYENDVYLSSESAVRIPMNPLNQEATTIIEKISAMIGIIDYRNISLQKRVVFNNVKPGIYTIKLFMENAAFSSNRQYIGFTEVEVLEDKKISLSGSAQRSVTLSIIDQNGEYVNDAFVEIQKGSSIVSRGFSDEHGSIILTAPSDSEPYELVISLNGEECFKETFQLKSLQRRGYTAEISIERYNIDIDVKDTWGLPTGIDLTPILLNQQEESLGYAESISSSSYRFLPLSPAKYYVVLQYKSVTYREEIDLQKDTSLSITFPAIYSVDILVLDNHGLKCSDITLTIVRDGKEKSYRDESGTCHLEVPPGRYTTQVYQNDVLIGKRNMMVSSDSIQEFVTNKEPIYPILIYIAIIIIAGILSYFFYKKKPFNKILRIFPILLLLASLISPWWSIQGSIDSVNTITNLFLIPSKLITVTSSSAFITGDQGYLPDLFITMIQSIIGLIAISVFLMIIPYFIQDKKGKVTIIVQLFTTLSLLGCIGIFIFGMSTLSEISVGTLFGDGVLDFSIVGQSKYEKIPCSWGPSIGFYLSTTALVLHVLILAKDFNKDSWRKIWNKIKR